MSRRVRTNSRKPRCKVCAKAVYASYEEARRGAVGAMRDRPGMLGLEAYWSRKCNAFHVGQGSDHKLKRYRRRR